ncbi:MAG: RNase adapter RapZ [Peptococcaceae bacterium]|nr:RNase adapter RapZ [Peptococcaceae bacterium]
MDHKRLVIVTGLSGAGKTQAVRSLEDLGFFCVDNLPPTLIPKFVDLCTESKKDIDKIALVVDVRGREFFNALSEVLNELDGMGVRYEILFLEASGETLIRRFKETRRSHPLGVDGDVLHWIEEERNRLQDIRGRAHKVIDTSNLSNSQLREEINNLFGDGANLWKIRVMVVSFGYKYGMPMDSDLVFDVRFMPNPHYDPGLGPMTGNDREVQDYVMNPPESQEFIRKLFDLIDFLLPQYIKEGKTSLTIAIGCTGGVHRSVALANKLSDYLNSRGYNVRIKHRDINRKAGS